MTNHNPAKNQSQLALFDTPKATYPNRLKHELLTAEERQKMFKEAFDLYASAGVAWQDSYRLLEGINKQYQLYSNWFCLVRALMNKNLLDELKYYYGSDTPTDKSREYLGYSTRHRLKKGATWC